jgi:hypothetical protein
LEGVGNVGGVRLQIGGEKGGGWRHDERLRWDQEIDLSR